MTLTQPIKIHGGKHYLAKWILSHFHKHLHYVDTHFGGGSVLLEKNPHGHSEVVNDINYHLTNFWRVLQTQKEEFISRLQVVPFSEIEFNEAKLVSSQATSVEAAILFFIRARQSRQGLMKDFATLSRNRVRRGMNEQISSWLTAIEGLEDVHKRLQRVVILNQDAIDVILSQDGPNTLFYLDPPYLHTTRVTTADYAFEMTAKQHERLLGTLSTIKGKFVLSGYSSALYEKLAMANNWFKDTKDIDNKASSASEKDIKTECLWMNYDWTKR